MKIFIRFITLLILFAFNANAANKQYTKANPRTLVKCYVELENGKKTLYFAAIPKNDFYLLKKTLVGQQMKINKKNQRVTITAVYECTLNESTFNDRKARKLDVKAVR